MVEARLSWVLRDIQAFGRRESGEALPGRGDGKSKAEEAVMLPML